ncbi:AimR family lysis-lysogeny pheromone receptor [Halobacillus litoralis]|uniref:AimR family lysis-lysogeny pheromone receptor n=1 Tax=Halobacillus litoralis TaxID=45668 RepID=UPI001CD271B2|nr:AimR family lysis-lysogeny pheromone receptor [Halobacillus litoralis]MCA0972601.1 AimR family lysis-lysogeny pheromone receptor [Halobacillus litoralis]
MAMKDYQVLKPKAIQTLQMDYDSIVYDVYLDKLRNFSKEEAVEQTRAFCLIMRSHNIEDQIACLEFLYMNDFIEDVVQVLNSGVLNDDVKLLYRMTMERLGSSYEQSLHWLKSLHFSHPSLHCLHQAIMAYRYFDMNMYQGLDGYIESYDQALQQVNEPLALYFFERRYHELLFHYYWKSNHILLARRYAYKLINKELSPRKKTTILHYLTLTYAFESYEVAMGHAYEALHYAEEHNQVKQIPSLKHRTIPFIAALHRQTADVTTPDFVETAHLAIADGRYEEGAAMLQSFEDLTPFQECYLGFALRDEKMIYNSERRFIDERGDRFFAQLSHEYRRRLKGDEFFV